MEIIIRKKLLSFNFFIWKNSFLVVKLMCKVLRNFTVPILSKIEITIDFNGPESQLHH